MQGWYPDEIQGGLWSALDFIQTVFCYLCSGEDVEAESIGSCTKTKFVILWPTMREVTSSSRKISKRRDSN